MSCKFTPYVKEVQGPQKLEPDPIWEVLNLDKASPSTIKLWTCSQKLTNDEWPNNRLQLQSVIVHVYSGPGWKVNLIM